MTLIDDARAGKSEEFKCAMNEGNPNCYNWHDKPHRVLHDVCNYAAKMEEALLAAVELEAVVQSIFGDVSMGEELGSAFIDVETSDLDRASMALAAFRKALEQGNE